MKSICVEFKKNIIVCNHEFHAGWIISAIKVRVCNTPFWKKQYYYIVTSVYGCFVATSLDVIEKKGY